MNSFVVPVIVLAMCAADQKLSPYARLECEGEAWQMAITPDARTLFAVVKHEDQHDLVAWDLDKKSKTILVALRTVF